MAGGGERDPVAQLEGGEKIQLKGGRRAGRDDDLGGLDRDPVPLAVMLGDRFPQRRDAERVGIADAVFGEGAARGLEHRRGGRRAGLADFEVDDRMALGLALVGGAEDVHRDKRRDQPAAGGAERRRRPPGLWREAGASGRGGWARRGGL